MRFSLIIHGTEPYKQAKQLRQAVLRLPLRLVLTKQDLADEHRQLHFAAMENDLVVGTLTMKPLTLETAKLRQMAISPNLHGKGVGKKLVEYAENALRRAGYKQIETDARVTAQAFYAKLGYVAEGQPFTHVTLPHIRMVKKL